MSYLSALLDHIALGSDPPGLLGIGPSNCVKPTSCIFNVGVRGGLTDHSELEHENPSTRCSSADCPVGSVQRPVLKQTPPPPPLSPTTLSHTSSPSVSLFRAPLPSSLSVSVILEWRCGVSFCLSAFFFSLIQLRKLPLHGVAGELVPISTGLWVVGGKHSRQVASPWREPMHAWGEHANSMQKDPQPQELNPGPSRCKATVLPTAPPCSPHFIHSLEKPPPPAPPCLGSVSCTDLMLLGIKGGNIFIYETYM
ncbi:hypothetical protein ATANTOWER_026471 [Ataeniobius toweri]|uniref:Uncharacterized protein n=1 Tax=Ataeniobius toweri TaxID=208326 RepID=A0ABU7B3S3_9TELE|nr:hypothetical protein [Ataeniobius toweri]